MIPYLGHRFFGSISGGRKCERRSPERYLSTIANLNLKILRTLVRNTINRLFISHILSPLWPGEIVWRKILIRVIFLLDRVQIPKVEKIQEHTFPFLLSSGTMKPKPFISLNHFTVPWTSFSISWNLFKTKSIKNLMSQLLESSSVVVPWRD